MPWFCNIILLLSLHNLLAKCSVLPEQRLGNIQLNFELGKRCTYEYQVAVHTARGAHSTASQGFEIHSLVDVTPVAEESSNQNPLHTLQLHVYQPRMRRVRGERVLVTHPVNEEFEQQLSKPFFFRQYGHGAVVESLFPRDDDSKVIALKKGIAGTFQVQLNSVGQNDLAQVHEHDDSGVYKSRYTTLHSNDTHATVKREWTNKDYVHLADGTPAKADHKVQSQHTGIVHIQHGQIFKVHRRHNGVFESPKGHPRAENKPEYQENEQDIQVLTSGYSKLKLLRCSDFPKESHHRSRRSTERYYSKHLQGLYRDDLVFKDSHKINWKDVGGEKITFRPFYELMRCFTDPNIKDREIGDCAREIHKLAKHDKEVFKKMCDLVSERSHQNVTSWAVLVSVLAGKGDLNAQNILANALMSEHPRKLTLDEYESLLEGIFYIPKGPLHKNLFDALVQHARRDVNHGHESPMAMLVLSGLAKRAETAGYNATLSEVVVELIHRSYHNKSKLYHPDSDDHESYLRNHIWAFGNLGHISGLDTMLEHANHDSSGIRSAVVSGMRKLPAEHTKKFLLDTIYNDEHNDVKAAVIEVFTERHEDLNEHVVKALEHAFWHAEENDALDESVQVFLENHHNHPKAKHVRKRRHVLRRQKRALIPALRPREIQLGPNKRWTKTFGGKYLGAESAIQFRNQVKLRIGIFGGNFEVNLDNYAKIEANILKWGFDIVKGKAAFKASASFKNDIPKDLIHAVADAGDDIFAKVDGITNIIVEHIEKFKEKLKNLVPLNIQKLIDFVNKIIKFVENLIKPLKPVNLMKKILALAKKIIERLKNWEWLMKNLRNIQISLNKLTVVDNVFKKVMNALNKIMSIINSIKLRLPHGLPPNFKIEDLFKWLKSVSIDLHDIKIKEFFKSLGLNFVPKGFNLQMPFKFSIHFSFSMDRFVEVCMRIIKFANNFLDLSTFLDALESIRLPRLNLPRLEGKFPLQNVKWFNFGLSFDWRLNLRFDLNLKSPNFVNFLKVLGKLADFFKRFKLPSFNLEKFFEEIMPNKILDLSKLFEELFGKNSNSTAVGRNPADVLQDFFNKLLNLIDSTMPNITAISDISDFFKELGPAMKEFAKESAKKVCGVYKIALNASRDFKTFGENIENQGITILKTVDNTTQSTIKELVQFTHTIDKLIDDIEKNFTLATRGFVSKSLKELSKSLQEIQNLADKVVNFANGTASKANGVCNKAADFSADIIDDVQTVSRQALTELTSFIGPVSQKVKGIGQDLKTAVDNIEKWYKENMEARVGKISKIARLVADLLSILNTKKGFLGEVHDIAQKVNTILTHMKNIPVYAQKARETANDIINFADRAQNFKNDIAKLDLRKELNIDYDKKVRDFCIKFKKMAAETLNKIGGYDIVDEVNEFFTDEADKLIARAGSKLRLIKQPIEDVRNELQQISVMVANVMNVLINLKPFSNNFSPILATVNKLPDCKELVKILTESAKPCVQKAMIVGRYAIDQYKDMRKEIKVLHDMIPETWKSLKIQKCIKGGACISQAFIDQAKVIQEKVDKLKDTYKEASGYTEMLGTCKAGLDNITKVVDTVKLLIQQVKDFNLKDDVKKIKDVLRNVTGRNIAEDESNPSVRSRRSLQDAKLKIQRVMDYVRKAKEIKEKLEKMLQSTFKAMKSVYDNAIFEHIQKIEDVSKKVNTSYELWKKTKDINSVLQGLDNIIKEASDYGTKMTAITNGFSSPVVQLLTDTGELSDVIKPHMAKYIKKVEEATGKINGFFKKVTDFQNKIQLRQRGLDLSEYKEWSTYPYCSADVCLRSLRRSSSLYYSTIFTWKFPHLDDLSSMKGSGRWLTPGLFDDYKVAGITQLSESEILLGMYGVSTNQGKASILVITDLQRSTVKKIIQLGSPESPFTTKIGGVSIAKDTVWISDSQSNRVHRISKGSVTGSMSTLSPSWIGISKSYSVEGVATSVSFDEQESMLWLTDGNNGKGYGYRLSPKGDLLSSNLAPDKVLVIDKNARGMAIVRQFNTEYVVISRCVLRAGFQCKLEFHDLTEGNEISENSLSRVVRTPSGLESIDNAKNDLLVVAFSSGTYSEKDKIEGVGGDFEDRYFRIKLPILKITFGITENCLMFKVMGEWIISPRRLFPFGDLRCGHLRRRRSIANELLESDVYSRELEEVHSRTKRSSGEMPSCMTLFRGNIRRGYQQFMPEWQQVIIVFGIPVKLFAGAGGYWFVDYQGKVCMKDRTFRVGLLPGAWISVYVGASIPLWIVEAGITIEAILLETYLIPELTVKIDKWPLKACIELKIRMTPLKIRVWLWYRFRLCIKIRCKCFSCRIRIGWCSKKTFAEWWWSARQIERTLFSTCKADIDRTPPVAGTCTARQVGDKAYFVQWHGFKEDTAINHYWVKIGSISGSGDDYGANVGTSLSKLVRNLEIMNGRDVFASVRATNDGGLDSRLALCPLFQAKRIGPQIRYVYDGVEASLDKDYQSDDYAMGVNFAWSKPNQKIVDVKWGISTSSTCTFDESEVDVYGLAPVGESTTIQISGLNLKHGAKYYTRIIATNSVGLRTVMCSDGITVDTTPPVAGVFYDGAGEKDKDFIPSTKRVRATFEPFKDDESPMAKYEWKVIQYINLKPIDVTPFVNIPLTQRTPLMENLALELGQKYHLILQGTNAAGLQASKESDGFIADNTSPTCGLVLDVLSANDTKDVDFVRQLTSIQAKWNCLDKESSITEQLLAIGTYPGGDNIKKFENIEDINATAVRQDDGSIFVKIDDIKIKPKVRYHVTIIAYNGAGLRRTITSDGILIDTTPPFVALQYIKDGFKGKDVNYTKERFTYSAHWEQAFVDPESGIAEYRMGLGTASGLTDVKQFVSIGRKTGGTLTGLILDAGKKYYVTVIGCNGVQMCINGSSNGAIVDFVPPHTGDVITGFAGPPVLFQWITKSVWARWEWCPADEKRTTELIDPKECKKSTFYDVHSGIYTFGLSVTSLASVRYLDDFKEVGKVQMSGRHISLNDGVYSVVVRAKDKAGMTADGFSNTFIVDSTPPEIINLQHGLQGEKIRYTSNVEHQFRAYFELEDDLSRIFAYKVYVGSYPGADDVSSSPYIKLQRPLYTVSINWTSETPSKLENNRKYFVTVLALNGAGLIGSGSSQALFSDTEPPRNAIVLDGWGMEDIKYQSYASIYRAHWYGLTDFSGVQSTFLGLKSSLDKKECDVKAYELVPGNANYHVIYGLNLTSGSKYYACLKVIDNAENVAYFSSNGVIVDSTPPIPGQVFDGISGADIDVQIESSILWASWKNFKESETEIVQYLLAFGTAPGKDDIQEFTSVGLVLNAASTRLKVSKLTSGQRYYATVAALNSIGIQSASVYSNGVMVDSTPPVFTTRASHGASEGIKDKYTSTNLLSAYWKCADNETGLDSVSIAFGLQPGSSDVMNFTNVPVQQTDYFLNTNLKLGIRYFVTVICKNKVGLKSISSSNGIVYDNTPPKGRFVRDGAYQNSTTKLDVRWSFYDIESGINKYQVFVLNSDLSTHQGPYEFTRDIKTASITLKRQLEAGKTYYTNVTAYNGVGMLASLRSNGFVVDNTPPTCDRVWHGDKSIQRFIGLTTSLLVSWNCFENESDITQIRFAIQDVSNHKFVLPFHSKKEQLNSSGSTFVTGGGKWLPKYEEGKGYRVGIELTNAVNLKSVYWTAGVLVDSSPPVVNNLRLAFNPTNDALVATWKVKDEQSGVASLKWGLGSRPEKPDIVAFQDIDKNTAGLSLTKQQVQVQQGRTYFVFLLASNNAGLSSKAVSNGAVIDRSPPKPGVVTAQYALPLSYDRNKNTVPGSSFIVSWTGFTDDESGIAEYSWSVGTNLETVRKLDDSSYTTIPANESTGGVQIKDYTLVGNITYYVCIRATNGAGLKRTDCSDGMRVVLGKFSAGVVNDGPRKSNKDTDFQLDDRAIWAFWDGFEDPVFGVSAYEWCIGDHQPTPSAKDFCKWSFMKVNHLRQYAHRFFNLTLTHGTKYYATVKAFNTRGESVYATSDGVLVDRSTPVGNVVDVAPTVGKDTLYMSSPSPPTITWEMDDKESGMSHFTVAVGSYTLQDDILNSTRVSSLVRSSDLDDMNLTLSHGLSFSITLSGYNKLGLKSTLTTQQVVVDLTPPLAGVVFDGNGTEDADYQTNTQVLSAHWTGFKDRESTIVEYKWCIGLKQGACDVLPMTSTGLQTSATAHVQLKEGTRYFTTVEASNAAGFKTLASSDGVTIDSTSPTIGAISFVQPNAETIFKVINEKALQSSGRVLKAEWTIASDLQSGIINLQYCIGTNRSRCDVVGWQNLNKDASALLYTFEKPLPSGTIVYLSVKATNGAGLSVMKVSGGLMLDWTAPAGGSVSLGNVPGIKYLKNDEGIEGDWGGFSDNESGLDHYEWAVCHAIDHKDCLTQFINVGLSTKLKNDDLDLKPGIAYVLIIRAYNKVNLYSSAVSNIFIVDISRPTPGDVFDGDEIGKDLEVQSSTTTISVSWEPFKDENSRIDNYQVCVGSKPSFCDIRSFQSVGDVLVADISGLDLTHKTTYYSTVRATNEAGYQASTSTNGIKVDKTPPVGGSVRDGNDADDVDFQAHGSFVSANWDQFIDDETGVVKYIWCAGTSRGACDVVQDTEISDGSTKAHVQVFPSIVTGVTVFIKVTAVNGAGGTTTVYSDGVTIDNTPPQVTQVKDLETNGTLLDIDFLESKTKYCTSWTANDPESGVLRSEVSVCTAIDSKNCLVKSADVGNRTLVCMSNLALIEGVKYITTVRVVNNVGLTNVAMSDGFVLDSTPPVSGEILIGKNASKDTEMSPEIFASSSIDASWYGFWDKETSISKYHVCLGNQSGSCDVTGWKDVGLQTNYRFDDVGLLHGSKYYVSVIAENQAGLKSIVTSSQAINIDKTAPLAGSTIFDGIKEGSDIDYQLSKYEVIANWKTFEDSESFVTKVTYCIGSAPGYCDILPMQQLSPWLHEMHEFLSNPMKNGQQFYVTVQATNGAGLTTTVTSDGVVVDTTPPLVGQVFDGYSSKDVDFIDGDDDVVVNWADFKDDESGIKGYEVAICNAKELNDCPQKYTNVNNATSIKITGLDLDSGTLYIAKVKATNQAGLETEVSSNGFIVDFTPPIKNVAWIGSAVNQLVQYQSDTAKLRVGWMPFLDGESGIANYELCVQSANSTSCSDYVTVGRVTNYIITGLSMEHGKSYFVVVKAANGAGMTATTETQQVLIDTTPPKLVTASPSPEIRFSCTEELVSVDWDEFEDPESKLSKYEWCVGTSSGRCDVTSKQSSNVKLIGQKIVSRIKSGTRLFASVSVFNGAGLKTVVSSKQCLVITVAPRLNMVSDLKHSNSTSGDIDWASNMKTLTLQWSTLGSFISDISRMRLEVAVTQSSDNKTLPRLEKKQSWKGEPLVQSFMAVHVNESNVTIETVPMASWEEYRGVVRVWNEGGIYSERSSDGLRIEPSPPLPRKVVLRDNAVKNEKSRWLPNLHLPSFNLSGLDPDVRYVSSPEDITIAVSDFSNGTNSSYAKLNRILDSGAFSPTKEFKLVVTRITSEANETNTTEHSLETKTLPGFADPSGPCCANHTPSWLTMKSDIHYKPTSTAQEFGSSVVQLPNDYVAISSLHKVFIFSKKDRLLKNKVISLGDSRTVYSISYSQNRLFIASHSHISIYRLRFDLNSEITVDLESEITKSLWPDLTAKIVMVNGFTLVASGKISAMSNVSALGVFQMTNSTWKLFKVVRSPQNDPMFGASIALNDHVLAVLTGSGIVAVYSAIDYSELLEVDLSKYNVSEPTLKLTQDNNLVMVSNKPQGKAVVIRLQLPSKTSSLVCSFDAPDDIRLSGHYDLLPRDGGNIIALGMQTSEGRDGAILTGFDGLFTYHPYHKKGKCLGLGKIIAREDVPRVDDGTPRASVSVEGSTILFGTPGVLTWPDGSEKHGTGRVYSMVFCPRNYKRTKTSHLRGQDAFQCEPCESGRKSLGAITRICEICQDRRCASPIEDDPIHFVSEICDSSQCPLDKIFDNKTNAIKIIQENGTFFEEGAVNEYIINLVETTRADMSTTSKTEPFIIDTSSPSVGTVYDGLGSNPETNCSNNETFGEDSQCSTRNFQETDIDYTNNTSEVHARWVDFADNESDIAEYFFCVGSKPLMDDIRQCQSTGLRQNASEYGFDFKQGDTYYVTVVACNNAQRCSAGHSNGVTVDTTPPVMQYVRDGVLGPDIDYQNFVDIIFAYFRASDPDSGVNSYEVAWGTAPGLVDVKDYEEIGNTTTWFAQFKDNALKKNTRYFATVRATNKAGLLSEWLSSNGVLVGKSEYIFDQNASASFFFDTVNMNPNGTRKDGGVGKTYGTLDVPQGAVKEEVKLTCYSLDKKTLESNKSDDGPVSNPEKTKPKQFMLGNYSFQIKAVDPTNNTVQEGYKFAKPIKISMFYDVDNLVNANKRLVNNEVKNNDVDPVLYLWDLKNQTWIDASLTCPEPYSHVNRSIKMLTVQICHLTQFAFYWSFKAQNGLMMFDKNTSVHDANGDINIHRQSTNQQIQLPVKRSKGSSGNIEVTWSLYSNESNHHEVMWPESGKLSFQEGQWNSSIELIITSNRVQTDERIIFIRLDNATNGAILASHDQTTTKFVISSNLVAKPEPMTKWIIIGVCSGIVLAVLMILIIIVVIWRRKKSNNKRVKKSVTSRSIKYTVTKHGQDNDDGNNMEMHDANIVDSIEGNPQGASFEYDNDTKSETSDGDPNSRSRPSSAQKFLEKMTKKQSEVSGIANSIEPETMSNASTSDDEGLQEVKPRKKFSLKKKLSSVKPNSPRQFENPAYGSLFELHDKYDEPEIRVENFDSKADANNGETVEEQRSNDDTKKPPTKLLKAWATTPSSSTEDLITASTESLPVKDQETLDNFGDIEPENESSVIKSGGRSPVEVHGSFTTALPGSFSEENH